MCKYFNYASHVLYHVIEAIIPFLGELAYIPYTCLPESEYFFCMRLNFHRLLHRSETMINSVTEKKDELVTYIKEEFTFHPLRTIHEKVDQFIESTGADFNFDSASWSSFTMITVSQFILTIIMGAFFVLDIKLGYMNFDNIVGLMA